MRMNASKLKLQAPDQALPGRATKMPVPAKHFVSGARLEPRREDDQKSERPLVPDVVFDRRARR